MSVSKEIALEFKSSVLQKANPACIHNGWLFSMAGPLFPYGTQGRARRLKDMKRLFTMQTKHLCKPKP